MRILVTNDDGIYSPGIAALADTAKQFGEVRIVAPDVEMSSTAQSITARYPVSSKHTPLAAGPAFRVNGTPGDCVMLGTSLWGHVDLVLSGINIGTNLGNSMWHSGTIAGAKQAVLMGIRGIALSTSFTRTEHPDFEMLKPWVARVLEMLLDVPDLPLVNVNFPRRRPRGAMWTRQSVRHYGGKVTPTEDPGGHAYYWLSVVPEEAPEEGTDRWAFEQGFVSLTPLGLDLTDHDALARVRDRDAWKKLRFE